MDAIVPSVLAGISVLVLRLLVVFASGMFPTEARPASMAGRRGWWLQDTPVAALALSALAVLVGLVWLALA